MRLTYGKGPDDALDREAAWFLALNHAIDLEKADIEIEQLDLPVQ